MPVVVTTGFQADAFQADAFGAKGCDEGFQADGFQEGVFQSCGPTGNVIGQTLPAFAQSARGLVGEIIEVTPSGVWIPQPREKTVAAIVQFLPAFAQHVEAFVNDDELVLLLL